MSALWRRRHSVACTSGGSIDSGAGGCLQRLSPLAEPLSLPPLQHASPLASAAVQASPGMSAAAAAGAFSRRPAVAPLNLDTLKQGRPVEGAGSARAELCAAESSLPNELSDSYDLGRILGTGTTAMVRVAKRRADGRKFALKLISSPDEEVQAFAREEYELIRSLRHPCILMAEAFHRHSYGVAICMELCAGGSIQSHVKANGVFAEDDAKMLFTQLLRGVDYMHQRRTVHRDLKPDNLLLAEGQQLKIADFNSAKHIGGGACGVMLTDRGTRMYSAPELRFGLQWNERVDVWASGLCLFFMMRGDIPFDIQRSSVASALLKGELPNIRWEDISDLTQDLVSQCLKVDMRDRPPAMELLLHPSLCGDARAQHVIAHCHSEPNGRVPLIRQSTGKLGAQKVAHHGPFVLTRSCGLLAVSVAQLAAPSSPEPRMGHTSTVPWGASTSIRSSVCSTTSGSARCRLERRGSDMSTAPSETSGCASFSADESPRHWDSGDEVVSAWSAAQLHRAGSAVDMWRERRDGRSQLRLLAEAKYSRGKSRQNSIPEVRCSTIPDHVQGVVEEDDSDSLGDSDDDQPLLASMDRKLFFTRASLIDWCDPEDETDELSK